MHLTMIAKIPPCEEDLSLSISSQSILNRSLSYDNYSLDSNSCSGASYVFDDDTTIDTKQSFILSVSDDYSNVPELSFT